ncbi:MFS transporter [Pontibacter sp. G13]|uniref:MFS transporter n=1 Tax=Pontibacter sp. G13 TaxID=3074898 RepID=UPI002889536E|nr:MFS transporter [Pontibacter sp. G13]WNJ19729.1 MFS transporter [Pontibacter sp. G13]
MKKPRLSFWQIWNMSVGFLGIQMGFALQNANASRILQIFGADVHHLSWFWLVAPLTGMIVQPIIGKMSDNTWTRLGRRRPFFLAGAILAAIGLILLPNAGAFVKYLPLLWMGAGFLMIMDASFNIAMEPFRALVADKLNSEQRTMGFSIQTVLIGIGAVVGSWLPYVLTEWFGMEKTAAEGEVPTSLIASFVIGAVILLATILWTIARTKEYSPEEQKAFEEEAAEEEEEESQGLAGIIQDFANMPKTMKQLGVVQFFSWFALFSMWVYTTPAIAHHVWGLDLSDTSSEAYQDAGNWVGIIFGVYNAVSAVFAFFLPRIAAKFGRRQTHAFSLVMGGIGLISFFFIHDKYMLIASMFGVGIAWASILAMPYAILGGALPAKKIGVYMGIFNFFITLPQIVNGIFGGPIIKAFYGGDPIWSIVTAGVFMILAAISVMFVDDVDEQLNATSPDSSTTYFNQKK